VTDPQFGPPTAELRPWGRDLIRPAPLVAITVLVLNDHLLKGMASVPPVVTGKLSDIAGLFFFPIFLVALVEGALAVARRPPENPPGDGAPRGRARTIAAVLTAVVFSCFELIPTLAEAVSPWIITTPDPTDLLALPMVVLSWWWLRRQERRAGRRDSRSAAGRLALPAAPGRLWRLAGVITAAAASTATSLAPTAPLPPPPLWTVRGQPTGRAGCAEVSPWISKSGREGIGVTVRLRAMQDNCVVTLRSAAIVVDGTEYRAASLPAALTVGSGGPSHMYLAFVFDNLRAWKEQRNKGELVLGFADVGASRPGAITTLRYPMLQWQPPTPEWEVYLPPREWSCLRVELVMSGGEPGHLTATLRLQPTSEATWCRVTIGGARFYNADAMVDASELPVELTLRHDRVVTVELAFAFARPPARASSKVLVELDNEAGESTTIEWALTPAGASGGGASGKPTP
jgi:hypothetical protein